MPLGKIIFQQLLQLLLTGYVNAVFQCLLVGRGQHPGPDGKYLQGLGRRSFPQGNISVVDPKQKTDCQNQRNLA